MIKIPLMVFILFSIIYSCRNSSTLDKNKLPSATQRNDTSKYTALKGVWVKHNNEGFTLIEIRDTSDISYYQFMDRKAYIDTVTEDRYWYYNSKASMGYWNNSNNSYKADVDIWIATDKFRFDYKLKGDTLIEFDKMGDQGKFAKVYNDNNLH